jgi:hypothetical protein
MRFRRALSSPPFGDHGNLHIRGKTHHLHHKIAQGKKGKPTRGWFSKENLGSKRDRPILTVLAEARKTTLLYAGG